MKKSEKKRRIIIRFIGFYLRRLYYSSIMAMIGLFTKIDNSKVLFSNFFGKGFGGNPRAIAEEIHRVNPRIRLIWLSSNEKIDNSLPNFLIPVRPMSLRFLYELSTASVWVYNQPIARGVRKKKKQLYIQTFHGDRTPKKVYYQNIGKKRADMKNAISERIIDYGLTGSTSGEKIFSEGLGYTGKLLKNGCPRNDCLINLINNEDRIKTIKKNLKIEESVKLLLFAPTFRQGKVGFESNIDFNELLDLLENKTGFKWKCILRAHFHTHNIIIDDSNNERFIHASDYPDMADLLLVSDMLITDYSSSSGDFCLTGRPIVLYIDDMDTYTRELTFNFEDSPYFVAKNAQELKQIVENMTSEKAKKNDQDLIKFWGIYETGEATKKVTDVIIRHMESL